MSYYLSINKNNLSKFIKALKSDQFKRDKEDTTCYTLEFDQNYKIENMADGNLFMVFSNEYLFSIASHSLTQDDIKIIINSYIQEDPKKAIELVKEILENQFE